MSTRRGKLPTVLLTNDDGPPSPESPFLHSFVRALKSASPHLDSWSSSSSSSGAAAASSSDERPSPLRVQVVIPSSQRSWIGKAYLIADRIKGQYYYAPCSPSSDGTRGELRTERRRFDPSEEDEWILLDGTPASCANIGVHSLFPRQIDLVLSGPNFGRNTSSSFSLSSGTLGAALDGALGGVPAIALSYGIFERPVRDDIVAKANQIAVGIVKRLWEYGFGPGSDADLYSVNIPLTPSILEEDCKVVWTTEAITRYSRLFAPASSPKPDPPPALSATESTDPSPPDGVPPRTAPFATSDRHPPLDFRFSPDITALVDPKSKAHAEGSDAEVLNRGHVTVTPLKAAFRPAERPRDGPFGEGKIWAWKL